MAMARRSRSAIVPVAILAVLGAIAFWAPAAFVQSPAGLRGGAGQPTAAAAAGAVAAVLPAAAQAVPEAGAIDMPPELADVGSSVNLAAFTEILMVGIVMGTVPITVLGLLVAAWLQFKKGPTLGL
eukprot:CAMPEP_0171180028 /NCGR_PEP_ID=MMETSP0790-20130122/13551_1 /TAXON_ID=2925 /ORGANISM="Alexandrium catenella, Strain OF101" /LENGTH=125 /DNA_ID=CAMNT_0011644959 /DNA_START=71 /DNA_END=448 /DNA_ORIENTATION=-